MEVVRHHHEFMQFELAGQGVRPKHVNKKPSFALRLEKMPTQVGLRSGEERPHGCDDITPVRFSRELYHAQRLKPKFYYGPDGPAEARALIRT